jgi:hypothetical protein
MSKTELKTTNESSLPAHLQGGKTTKLGNIDSTDLIIPRVKLLQAISPELDTFDAAKKGEFWHTIASQSLGNEIRGVPILLRKSYVLWAPRNDDRGILARANDGLNWDLPGAEFKVKPKNSPHEVTYKLGKTVHERTDGGPALSEFGSSVPGDPRSAPAAALTYQFLWFFPDFPELSPAIILNTRSSVKPAQNLISKVDMRPVDHFAQQYRIGIVQESGDEGPYYNYAYHSDGYADEQTYNTTKALFEKFNVADWRANDENEEPASGGSGGGGRRPGPADSDKF